MNYISITNQFINEYSDYKNDLRHFNIYLEKMWNGSLEDDSIRFMLQGLDVNFLVESLRYNVEVEEIYKSKSSAKRYATVIGQFFDYLRKNTEMENKELYDAISFNRQRENAYMKKMMSYISKSDKLAGIIEIQAIGKSDAERIIEWADQQIENVQDFRKMIAAAGIKMMLLYGITYRELRRFSLNQYNEERDTIKLDIYELRLPIKFSIQMKCVKEEVVKRSKDYFFVDDDGNMWGEITSSSGIPDYLSKIIGNTGITGVIKYGITQLLEAGISDSVIKKMTGASDKIISGCLDQDECNMNRNINNKLVTIELYDKF